MNGKMIFGQYYNSNSFIHRLDPRTKLITLFSLMIAIFLMTEIYLLVGMLVIIFLIVLASKIPLKKFIQSFRMMTMILVFTFFFQILLVNTGKEIAHFQFTMRISTLLISIALLVVYILLGKVYRKFRVLTFLAFVALALYLQTTVSVTPSLFKYSVRIFDDGLITSLKIMLRIVNLICLSSMLTFTTKPTDLNMAIESVMKPLNKIKVPVSIFAMMISIALRFIPTLINEANRILKAQASRGVDFKEGKLKDKVVQIISLLVPMIVIAYKRAEELSNAMEARGYIPGATRTSVNQLVYKKSDIAVFSFAAVLIGAVIALRIFI